MTKLAHCIGCGCNDQAACCNEDAGSEPCHWSTVDRKVGLGVCSECRALAGLSPYEAQRAVLANCLSVLLRMIPEYCQAAGIVDDCTGFQHDHAIAQAAAQLYGPHRERWPEATRRAADGEFE